MERAKQIFIFVQIPPNKLDLPHIKDSFGIVFLLVRNASSSIVVDVCFYGCGGRKLQSYL